MIITILSPLLPDGGLQLEVFPDFPLSSLKSLIAEETNGQIPDDQQFLYRNGHLLSDNAKTLEDHGLGDNDLLELHTRQSLQQLRGQGGAGAGAGVGASRQPAQPQQGPPSAGQFGTDSEIIRLRLLGDQAMMNQLREQQPELADAVNDPQRFSQIYQLLDQRRRNDELEKEREIARLNDDPFNIDSQRRIEEIIRQEAVRENLQNALEYNPESFGRVTMLYVPVEVNGHPVKAFVDSGAQATIMSPSCAEACNIMRLIDNRFAGIAKGVGTAKILGRVHSAQIKIGNLFLPCSFTVMEGKDVDLLLGLDMLKRHQASINLKDNLLEFGDSKVPFLPEGECPSSFDAPGNEGEPVVEGPAGSLVGGQSGAMIQPPAPNPNFQGSGHTLGGPGASGDAGVATSTPQTLLSPTTIPTPGATTPTAVTPTLGVTGREGGGGEGLGSGASFAPPPVPAGRQTIHPPEMIGQLTSLGFSEAEAIQALNATNGNVELAASLLFN